ncbi:hypothetical protein [Brevundimonas goettingensis]|uniref:Uncharacterized protein n=1 Tax=Brevundimonas goettingensis TaxID=2774190 RepID=A0A975C649_9CAUL|nr:hypothetical protein [Brevundimonas goettingensis]QTC92287.1 hypothetical protein IFJ75_05175 [Brevundimonas goettingensis]
MATAQDDGLDQVRRDLIDLVLREAGGRVAADPKSPVAQLLAGIVRREMAGAVEELRHGGAVIDSEALADAIARRMGTDPRGAADFRSGSTPSAPNRTRDIILIGVAALLAVAIFLGGFALGGGLEKLQPAPAAVPTTVLTDPNALPPTTTDGLTPSTSTAPATGAATTGMATQLQERPR